MLKEAINRILNLAEPHTIDFGGFKYTDKHLERIQIEPIAKPLKIHSLSAIVDYITADADKGSLQAERRFIIHVADYNSVLLYTELNLDKERECLLDSHLDIPPISFGRWQDLETFIINLQTNFVADEERDKLISLAGTVTADEGVTLTDDGITQQVTAKTGISLVQRIDVPNPVTLAPFRTFTEVEQPKSQFVFRIRKNDSDIEAALFGADGNAWKHDAIIAIRDYLKSKLSDKVIILA